jgi:hypothetical protein
MDYASCHSREWVRGFEPRVAEGLFLLPARAPRDATLASLSLAESCPSKKISFDLFTSFTQLSRRTEVVRGEFDKVLFRLSIGGVVRIWELPGQRGNQASGPRWKC